LDCNVNNLWLHTVLCMARFFKKRRAAACTDKERLQEKWAELDLNPTFSNKNRFNNSSASKSNKITVCVGEGSDPI